MQTKTAALVLFGVVYVAALAAEAALLGTHALTDTVGVPMVSSTVTLGLGAAIALIEPSAVAQVLAPPSAPPVAATPPVDAPGAPVAPAASTPAQITNQAAAPAMPGAGG